MEGSDRVIGRTVAVKILKAELVDAPGFLERFRAEGRHAARVDHEGIARVYDYGEAGGTAFLVMELVGGEPLSAVLRRGLTDCRRTAFWTSSRRRRTHSTPLTKRPRTPRHQAGEPHAYSECGGLKVTDFGIARAADQVPFTAAGQVMGTVQYISPEAGRRPPVTAASDIYSLGVVAYEALVGRRPFTGESQVAIALAQVNDTPPPMPADLPEPVRDLVLSCMAKDPAGGRARPPTSRARQSSSAPHWRRNRRRTARGGGYLCGLPGPHGVIASAAEHEALPTQAAARGGVAPTTAGQLDQGLASSLTIVAARAGLGKSTLLAVWLAEASRRWRG